MEIAKILNRGNYWFDFGVEIIPVRRDYNWRWDSISKKKTMTFYE